MITKDGGPAFPCVSADGHDEHVGMSLRDYLAAKALGPAVAYYERFADQRDELPAVQVAQLAYRIADAMIAERDK